MVDADGAVRALMFGPPGSGKGTQAAILAERFEIPAISTGDMLREAVAEGSELGRRVESTVSAGQLVDDDTMGSVVRRRLDREDAREGFLLDGYPRTIPQAETLDEILEDRGWDLTAVVFLEVPEDVLVDRALGRGREDDSEAVIRKRIEVYREKTEPVIGYYDDRDVICRIDGDRSVEAITDEITEVLEERA